MTEETGITPRTITELKQVTPQEIEKISEDVISAERTMNQSREALEDLSASLNSFAYSKAEYDKAAGEVKRQMRELLPRM